MGNTLYRLIDYIFNGKLKHISRFSVVGAMNTFIDFAMFTVFNGLLGVNYSLSQVIGYSCGVANSFIFNKKWTFDHKSNRRKNYKELTRFVLVNLLSLAVALVSINLLVKTLKVNVYISKIIVTCIAQIINFLCYKLLVFN